MLGKRNKLLSLNIDRVLYLYFLGLSTRSVSKAMLCLHKVKRSHVPDLELDTKMQTIKNIDKNKRI